MSPREYDESDARVRPSRSTRPRSKDRPSHSDAISALVTTVDRGRQTCITEDGTILTAMRARELGPKSVVTGDNVSIVGDVTGSEGSLARIVAVQDRRNSLSRTVDDAAQVERTIVANIDQLVIVVAAANPEPRRGLIDRFLVSAFTEGIIPKIVVTKTDISEVPAFLAEYAELDIEIIHTAIKSDSRAKDLAKLHQVLEGKISVLVGHSGVGKSTLINALVPEADRVTGDVNSDGWIIDTPGIRAFGLSHIDNQRIVDAFSDLSEVAANCLSNCSHSESSCTLDAYASPDGVPNAHRTARLASLRSLLAVKDSPVVIVEE
jgi:ribosome biogenesis GTPase / thiamine phosphate phosphatase